MRLSKRGLILSSLILASSIGFSDAYSQSWLDRAREKAREAGERVREKVEETKERTKERTEEAKEWSNKTRDDLEERARTGLERAEQYSDQKAQDIAVIGRNYYENHNESVARFVEDEVTRIRNDPTRVNQYGKMFRRYTTEISIKALATVPIQDESGRVTTLGSLADNYKIGENNALELGVYGTFAVFTGDPRFFTDNVKIVNTGNGYMSMNEALRSGFETAAIEGLQIAYRNSQNAFKNEDVEAFASNTQEFVHLLNRVNSVHTLSSGDKLENTMAYYVSLVKEWIRDFDAWLSSK